MNAVGEQFFVYPAVPAEQFCARVGESHFQFRCKTCDFFVQLLDARLHSPARQDAEKLYFRFRPALCNGACQLFEAFDYLLVAVMYREVVGAIIMTMRSAVIESSSP